MDSFKMRVGWFMLMLKDVNGFVTLSALKRVYRVVLCLYNRDGIVRDSIVQSGYGRRDFTERISALDKRCRSQKKLIRLSAKMAFAR